ncbi:MAG: arginine--tRNA ligase [Anaerolineaceae bacterium]|nr:arginine--tRNA ligase [Anaerolineaceae bacterium]
MFEKEQAALEQAIRDFCTKSEIPEPDLNWKPIPFAGHWGISISFFRTAASIKNHETNISVADRAQAMAAKIAEGIILPSGFDRIEAVRGYLNIYFSTTEFAARVLDTILNENESYGRSPRRKEQVMVEFSQPNTHKAFHVGHLRSAILGDVISRMMDAAGYEVIRANYPGDIGLHVMKWLWNYMKFHRGEKPAEEITRWMGDLYKEAVDRLEKEPDLEVEVRELYTRWDRRDEDVVALWKETREWSLEGFRQIYGMLDIPFDIYYFPSDVEKAGQAVVEELISKGIATDERAQGEAVVVKLDDLLGNSQEKYRVLVILRSDGTALYATEDLALAIRKFSDYPELKQSLYVVDVRQSLHFTQLFKTLELAGYPWAKQCEHIPYELVSLPGNVVMASREGTVVLLEDLIKEATNRAMAVVEEKNPELPEDQKKEISRAVAIGAVKYTMLSRENTKVVTFDWEAALDFNGQAAPFIQYAHVRACSILRNAGTLPQMVEQGNLDLTKAEVELIDNLSRFPEVVRSAADQHKPLDLTNYAFNLASSFHGFLAQCRVLQAEEPNRSLRIRLVAAVRQTLANSLGLMGITAPEAM